MIGFIAGTVFGAACGYWCGHRCGQIDMLVELMDQAQAEQAKKEV